MLIYLSSSLWSLDLDEQQASFAHKSSLAFDEHPEDSFGAA
jgi:hypothetical protein